MEPKFIIVDVEELCGCAIKSHPTTACLVKSMLSDHDQNCDRGRFDVLSLPP